MKNLQLLLLFLLFCTSTFGQKKYLFDYMLEYEFQFTDTSKVVTQYILTNSKDNSYYLHIRDKDSLNLNLYFIDYNGNKSIAYLDKVSFSKAESITLECKIVQHYINPFKHQTKNYDFSVNRDTLIDGKYYSQYVLKSNNPKREKKKKLGAKVFVVEENTSFHLPLLEHETAYEEWKLEKNIPNGIAKVMYLKSNKGNDKSLILRLVQYVKINKYLIVPEECDHSNPKSKILNH